MKKYGSMTEKTRKRTKESGRWKWPDMTNVDIRNEADNDNNDENIENQ